MARCQILLDTDVGIDDALMIVSIADEPDAEIVAIGSSHGNCSAAQAARNAIREQKSEEAYNEWARDIRARAYVEMREPPQ